MGVSGTNGSLFLSHIFSELNFFRIDSFRKLTSDSTFTEWGLLSPNGSSNSSVAKGQTVSILFYASGSDRQFTINAGASVSNIEYVCSDYEFNDFDSELLIKDASSLFPGHGSLSISIPSGKYIVLRITSLMGGNNFVNDVVPVLGGLNAV